MEGGLPGVYLPWRKASKFYRSVLNDYDNIVLVRIENVKIRHRHNNYTAAVVSKKVSPRRIINQRALRTQIPSTNDSRASTIFQTKSIFVVVVVVYTFTKVNGFYPSDIFFFHDFRTLYRYRPRSPGIRVLWATQKTISV